MLFRWYINIDDGNLGGHASPLVAEFGMELNDDTLLLGGDGALLEVRPKVIRPTQPTTLATAKEPCFFLDRVPIPFAVPLHVVNQHLVLPSRPWTLLEGLSFGGVTHPGLPRNKPKENRRETLQVNLTLRRSVCTKGRQKQEVRKFASPAQVSN